jgi:hypothetical protein
MGKDTKERKSKKGRPEESDSAVDESTAVTPVEVEEEEEEVVSKKKKKEKKIREAKETVASVDADAGAAGSSTEDIEKPKKKRKRSDDEEREGAVENNDPRSAEARAAPNPPKKPLPEGYICNACKQPGHAIYDCPLKIKKIHVEPKRIIFLSKIPKSWVEKDVMKFFADNGISTDKLSNLKLVADAKSNYMFKGIVLVTATGDEAISKVIALNGHELEGKQIVVKFNESLKKQNREPPQGVKTCYRCGQIHSQDPKQCPNPRICYKCKGTDHLSSDCPKKKMKTSHA